MHRAALNLVAAAALGACQPQPQPQQQPPRALAPSPITTPGPPEPEPTQPAAAPDDPQARLASALAYQLAADLSAITPAQRAILDQLIAAHPEGDPAAATKLINALQKRSPLIAVLGPRTAPSRGFALHLALIDPQATAELSRHAKRLAELERDLPIPEHLRRAPPAAAPAPKILDLLYRSDDPPPERALDRPHRLYAADGAPIGPLRNLSRAEFEALIEPLAQRVLAPAHRPHLAAGLYLKDFIPARELGQRLGPADVDQSGARTPLHLALGAAYEPLERAKADVIAVTLLSSGALQPVSKDSLATTYIAALLHHARPGGPDAARLAARLQLGRYAEEAVFRFDAEQRLIIAPDRLAAAAAQLVADIVQIQALGSELRGVGLLERYSRLPLELDALLDRHHELPRELLPRYPLTAAPLGGSAP